MDRRSLLQRIGFAGAIVVVTCIAYLGSLDGEFIADDLHGIARNPLLDSLSWENVKRIFTSFDDANYMPLKVLSLAVDRAVWGPGPFGYHLTNLLLHVGCALVIYSILLRMELSRGAACFVALLWAVHPLQVESVAWISERKNVLSGLFFFAAFRVYLEFSARPRIATYVGTLALFVLALLSKMNTIVLPAICLAYEATYRFRYRWRDLVASAPMWALAALAVWYNLSGSPTHGGSFHGGSPIVTWLSSSVVVFRYLQHTVFPVGLTGGYDVALRGTPFHPTVFVSLLGLILIGAVTVALVRRKKREAFWILWAAITLAPMLNIIPFRSMMNDRYMYLTLLGPLALVGSVLDSVSRVEARRVAGYAAAVAVGACVVLTARQVEHWSSPLSWWTNNATRLPIPAQHGTFQIDYAAKLAHLEAAVVEEPNNPTLHNNLGGLYYQANRHQKALEHLERAKQLRPDEPFNLMNLGQTYARLSRQEDAERALIRATELRPYNYLAWLYSLRFYLRMGDAAKARRAFNVCVQLRPDLPASAQERERKALQRLEE